MYKNERNYIDVPIRIFCWEQGNSTDNRTFTLYVAEPGSDPGVIPDCKARGIDTIPLQTPLSTFKKKRRMFFWVLGLNTWEGSRYLCSGEVIII